MICISSDDDTHPVTKTFTPLHYTSHNYISLHFTTLHTTTLHSTSLHVSTSHFLPLTLHTQLHFTTLHYTSLHFTTLHYPLISLNPIQISYRSISPHFTTLHLTSFSLHFSFKLTWQWICPLWLAPTDFQQDRLAGCEPPFLKKFPLELFKTVDRQTRIPFVVCVATFSFCSFRILQQRFPGVMDRARWTARLGCWFPCFKSLRRLSLWTSKNLLFVLQTSATSMICNDEYRIYLIRLALHLELSNDQGRECSEVQPPAL
jgi:hypothetical protein